jgi:hypothetical protein
MKKLFLALAIFGFVAFGVVGIQDIQASTYSIEMVKFDKDPKKDGDKKAKDSKASAEMKAQNASSKSGCCSSSSSCASKADCCSKSGEDCSKECPDKK